MAELLSVGLDVGTSTTSVIFSRLQVEDRASAFAIPRLEIAGRQVIWRSPVQFTPLLGESLVDGEGVRAIIQQAYRQAGITPEQVDTGAIIITGETSRKENAAAVAEAISHLAGEFVVATAGPDLESVLAAKGAGAVAYSERSLQPVVHIDIGGGTANLALLCQGQVTATACLNVGGRLIKLDGEGSVRYRSPVLEGLTDIALGQKLTRQQAKALTDLLARGLEMAVGLRPKTALLEQLTTAGTRPLPPVEGAVLSFSGGVAACMEKAVPWDTYGDLGPLLAQSILESRLCAGAYRLAEETVLSTVIGAGCHSTQLSGSTVYCHGVALPLKNLPVVAVQEDPQSIAAGLDAMETPGILHLAGRASPDYSYVTALADTIAAVLRGRSCYIALQADMAKALGVALQLRLGDAAPVLCIDSVDIPAQSYLDVGRPVGPALPVVVKTLAFG